MNMPTRETGTILAALRRWQIHLESRLPNSSETEELHSIATDGGSFRALAPEEIDELCESINLGDGSRGWNKTTRPCLNISRQT
jgi:hypothetical protein